MALVGKTFAPPPRPPLQWLKYMQFYYSKPILALGTDSVK